MMKMKLFGVEITPGDQTPPADDRGGATTNTAVRVAIEEAENVSIQNQVASNSNYSTLLTLQNPDVFHDSFSRNTTSNQTVEFSQVKLSLSLGRNNASSSSSSSSSSSLSSLTLSLSNSSTTASVSTISALQPPQKKQRRESPSKEEIKRASTITQKSLPPQFKPKLMRLGINLDDQTSNKPEIIIQKLVQYSDVEKGQSRLLIPVKQLHKDERLFLEKEEWRVLNEGEGWMKVKVIQAGEGVEEREMTLGRWPSPNGKRKDGRSSVSYILREGWTKVLKESGIQEKHVVQLWAFRYGQDKKQLGIAIVNLGHLEELKFF